MTVNSIEIKGEFFQSSYAVYVVEIAHRPSQKKYFYIGQTGDAHYPIARSPFYRMGGHFEYRKSTQNQIFKGLCRMLLIDEEMDIRGKREAFEAFLVESSVTYYVFPLADFCYSNTVKKVHRDKRHITLAVETALLQKFKKKYGDALLNKSLVSLKREPTNNEEEMIEQIIEELAKTGIEI